MDLARPRTVASIVEDLRRLGVRDGDLLMVHVSMRRVGPVEGGADGLVDALDLAVGPTGTVLVNTGVADELGWVNGRPEHERAALLAEAEVFDHRTTPSDPDNGVFAEVLRVREGTVPGDHPEGRLVARGAGAAELVADIPWDDYYGPGSPLERLVQRGGKVLRLGADIDTVTLLHYAEYLVDLPAKRRVRRHRRVHGPSGPEVRALECLDDSAGIVAQPPGTADYFGSILTEYLRTGRASVGTVGSASSELIDAADLVDVAVGWMAAHLR